MEKNKIWYIKHHPSIFVGCCATNVEVLCGVKNLIKSRISLKISKQFKVCYK